MTKEELKNKIEHYKYKAESLTGAEGALCGEIARLLAEIDRLRSVLEFYANRDTWLSAVEFPSKASCDEGQKARKALGDKNADSK